MADAKSVGRVVGVMFLLQFFGLMAGFMLLDALRSTTYLTTATADSARIKAGAIVLLANCALTIWISIASWKLFREYSQPMAIWLIVLSVIVFVMQAADTVHIMTMLALSHEHVVTGAVTGSVELMARMTRRFAHYLELLAIDFWLMMFYAILLRFGLVPRLIAGFALVTVLLQFFAVPVPGFLGYGINTNFGLPLALGMLTIAGWLIAKGMRGN